MTTRFGCDGLQGADDVRHFAMRSWCNVNGNVLLQGLHEGQRRHPIREVWHTDRRLPVQIIEYVCAITAEFLPQIRQEAILLLKRYVWASSEEDAPAEQRCSLQVVALVCVSVAAKNWQHRGISEQKLHWFSRNAFTRRAFIDMEVCLMNTLKCHLTWPGVLVSDWTSLLLYLVGPLFCEEEDAGIVGGLVAHITDMLAFEDSLMAAHLPSELAAASIHAAVVLCTKRFKRFALTARVAHLCRVSEEQMVQLSEKVLAAALGKKCAELIFDGSGMTAEESDLERSSKESRGSRSCSRSESPVAPARSRSRRHAVTGTALALREPSPRRRIK